MVTAQLAGASHVRPKGATPIRVSLVPAYKSCTAPNRTHGPPLGFPSCNPPVQESNFLTVGTPDANGAGANSVGSITYRVNATSGEVIFTPSISDVRCVPTTDAAVCNSANAAGGPDYSGQLESNATIRISDHYNGPGLNEAATVQDIPLPMSFWCANTSDTSVGGLCNITGPPPGCPPACPNRTVFMRQGIFIP